MNLIDEIYLIKDNGICYGHFKQNNEDVLSEDLKSSMLMGIQFGILESFKEEIKCLILKNGKRIYFENYSDGKISYKIIIVLENIEQLVTSMYDKDLCLVKDKLRKLNEYMETEGFHRKMDGIEIDKKLDIKIKELFFNDEKGI